MMEGKRKEEREGEREDVSAQMPRAGQSALGKGLLGPKGTSQAGGATLSPWVSSLPLLAEEVSTIMGLGAIWRAGSTQPQV